MERAGSNEQDVVGAYHSITRVDGRAFNDWQNVALHPFAGDVGAVPAFAPSDLVDLIEEDDARILDPVDRHARDLVHVNEALLLFLNQVFKRLVDFHFPLLGTLAEDVRQHVFNVDVHLLYALIANDFEGREIAFAGFDFDDAIVELTLTQLLAKFLASARVRIAR